MIEFTRKRMMSLVFALTGIGALLAAWLLLVFAQIGQEPSQSTRARRAVTPGASATIRVKAGDDSERIAGWSNEGYASNLEYLVAVAPKLVNDALADTGMR